MPSLIASISLSMEVNNIERKNKLALNIRDSLFMAGNLVISAGNYLLYWNGVVPLVPALCFVSEGVVNTISASTNLLLRNLNINNENTDDVLTTLNFLAAPLLPYAVFLLNWPVPNPKTMPVTYAFATAAVSSTLNHTITISKKFNNICIANNAESIINQQPTLLQRLTNTATSLLAPLAITGVSLMTNYVLNDNASDDNRFDEKATAFYTTITGLAVTAVSLLVNTGMELYENWCAKITNNFDIESINNDDDQPLLINRSRSGSLDNDNNFSADNQPNLERRMTF